MKSPKIPANESKRLAALRRYEILDTPVEVVFDDMAQLAAGICDTPMALISLIDEHRQWFKSRIGFDVLETPREQSFCAHAINEEAFLEIEDARNDERFADNPLVTSSPEIRFYAGAVLKTPEGEHLGTLCVLDRKARTLSAAQRVTLETLARQVVLQLELRRLVREQEQTRAAMAEETRRRTELENAQRRSERFMQETIDVLQDHVAIIDSTGTIIHVNRSWTEFAKSNAAPGLVANHGVGANYLTVCDRATANGAAHASEVAAAIRRMLQGDKQPFSLEYPCHSPTEERWFIARISRFGGDSVDHVVIAHQAITERRLAEQAVLDMNKTLAARVRARTQELERTHSELHESEEKFRSIFENAGVGLAVADHEGSLVQINRAFCEITGRESEELLKCKLLEIIHPEDRERTRALRAEMLTGESPGFQTELRYVRPDGKASWVNISTTTICDSAGKPVQTMALVHSIDRRKQAEYERDRFSDLALDMFVIAGTDGTVHRANPACTRILGYSEDELRAIHPINLIHEDDRGQAQAELDRLAQGKSREFLDIRVRTRDGDYRDLRWSAAPWKTEGLIVAIGRDVTSLRVTERALRERENMLARAEHLAHIGSWTWNAGSNRLTCSEGLCEIVGRSVSGNEHTLEELLALFDKKDAGLIQENIDSVMSKGGESELTCALRRPNGDRRIVIVSVEAKLLASGVCVGASGALLDVTEFRQTEDQLRTSELQLRALASRLQDIREEERTEISREIHDELGQMLTALKMDLTLLARDIRGAGRATGDSQRLIDALGSMSQLVDSTLRAVRRIARQLRPEVLDALGLVPAIEWQAGEFQSRTGIECTVEAADNLPIIKPEGRTSLFRIVQESLTNTARHANATAVRIRLTESENHIVLMVSDNGCGIGSRGSGGTTSLGLLGMRERATMIGGAFEVSGKEGAGTTITVRVPVAPSKSLTRKRTES